MVELIKNGVEIIGPSAEIDAINQLLAIATELLKEMRRQMTRFCR